MQPTRRQVLLVAGVATVTACTKDKPLRPTVPTAEETLRAQAITREQALVDAYTASLPHHPAQRALLMAVLGDHTAHLGALSPSPAPTASATPSRTPGRARSLAQLVALEKQAARHHAAAVERLPADCDDDSLPLLLASLAACEASHAVLL